MRGPSPSPRLAWMLVAAAVAFGALTRIAIHASSLGTLDADEAVWGLMAVHAFDGEVGAFYWSQAYGGTAEALLTAPLVTAFGHSVLAIRLVPVLLTAVAAVLVWRVGRRTLGEPAATVAGLLVWIWPAYLIWKSVRAHGFYSSGLVVVALVLLLSVRLVQQPRRRDAALLGLVLGVGWWLTPQTAVIAVPAIAWLTWQRPAAWRDFWVAAPAFVIGALPWLVSNFHHDWWSLHPDLGGTSYAGRVRIFFSATFPMELGVRVPFSSEWLAGSLMGPVLYLSLVGVLAWVSWRSRRTPLALATVCLLVYPFLHAVSPYAWVTDEPRYVLLLTPVLALLFAQPVRGLGPAAAVLTGAALLSVAGLTLMARSPEYERRADGLFVPRELDGLVAELERRGIDRLYSDYWVAYRLDFETGERLIAAETSLPALAGSLPRLPARSDVRYLPYDTAVRRLGFPPYVALRGTDGDARLRAVLLDAGYVRTELDGFVLYQRPER